jgi:hypothetical protein
MLNTLARSQKAKATTKSTAAAVTVAAKPKKGDAEDRPEAGPTLSAQEREKLIAQAAYFRAEKRGFAPGYELEDWVQAEAEVLRLIGCA